MCVVLYCHESEAQLRLATMRFYTVMKASVCVVLYCHESEAQLRLASMCFLYSHGSERLCVIIQP